MPQVVFPVMSEEQVNNLLGDQALLQAEHDKQEEILRFLNAAQFYRDNALQGQGKPGFKLGPPPVPPAGYVYTPLDSKSTAPPVLSERVVGERADNGTYADYGKQLDPKGTIIDNPHRRGAKLIKVVRQTPFGFAHYWEDVPDKA